MTMTYEHSASDFPPFMARLAMMRGGPRGRHRNIDDLERFAALRNLRGGGGPFGGGPFGGGRGRARRGEVRVALLLLLAEEPHNGYQLMQAIEERSDGRWRPSPGSVYPTLAQLEDEGLIRSVERDGTKLFEITDAGRAQLAERGDATAPWDEGDADGEQDISMRGLIAEIATAAMQVARFGDREQVEQAARTLSEARRALYGILANGTDA
jgi:DNA-binding PadR family transcriptional regulator